MVTYEAAGTMYPILEKGKSNPLGQNVSASARRKGARLDGMVNICELLINFVTPNKPKALTGLD
jgi:hypothetical protein